MEKEIQLNKEIIKAIKLVKNIDEKKLKERVEFYNKFIIPLTSELTNINSKDKDRALFFASTSIISIINLFSSSNKNRLLRYIFIHLNSFKEAQKDARAVIDLVNIFKEEKSIKNKIKME